MSFPSPTFVKWITKQLADLTEAGIISRFELIHKIESEHAERLDIWRNDADSGHAPQELAQEIQDSAERDAQSRTSGQPQRYVVYAYRGAEAMHESDYSPWEGRQVDAWPAMTILRGKVVVEDDRWVGDARGGEWIARSIPDEIRAGAAL